MKFLTIKIYGKVQGVGFREAARSEARKRNILGSARNESDGSLSIEAQGEEADLQHFLAWCSEGPWLARVDRIEDAWTDEQKDFKDFSVV